MGEGLKAQCSCGYEGVGTVGSTRAEHGKMFWFPHHCNQCNAVVSPDLLAENVCCDECGSKDIATYEATSKPCTELFGRLLGPKLRKRFGLHLAFEEASDQFCYQLKRVLYVMKQGNYCPQCRQNTMQFWLDCQFD